jgi:hypothetical protein
MRRFPLAVIALLISTATGVAASSPSGPVVVPVSGVGIVADSRCDRACESKYIKCSKASGKDMKQCSDTRRSCQRLCAPVASTTRCEGSCDKSYASCAREKSKKLKWCSDERSACNRRCS